MPAAAKENKVGMASSTRSNDTEPNPLPIILRSTLRRVEPGNVMDFPALSPTSMSRVGRLAFRAETHCKRFKEKFGRPPPKIIKHHIDSAFGLDSESVTNRIF